MTLVDLLKVPTAGPDDVAALAVLAQRGHTRDDVLAVVAKSEGNGCVNDFSRTLAALVWRTHLPGGDAVTVISGGTEGVLSPHVTLVCARPPTGPGAREGLVAAVASTAAIPVEDLGRRGQVDAVRDATASAVAALAVGTGAVALVLVKCPLLTSDQIASSLARGVEPVVTDTYESMARSRGASALGVALALGECTDADADRALAGDHSVFSSVASVSSGAELANCQVLVLANRGSGGRLRAKCAVMRDALDAESVQRLLRAVADEGGQVVQLFAKAEAAPSGEIRGRRHTMLTDSDLPSTRHARAAVGGLLAALVGDPCIYVSGGAEHQGPDGGGPVTVVYEVAP